MAFSSAVKSEMRASKSIITLKKRKNGDEWGVRFIGFAYTALHTKCSASLVETDCKGIKVMLKDCFLEIRPSLDWRCFFPVFLVNQHERCIFKITRQVNFNCQKHIETPCVVSFHGKVLIESTTHSFRWFKMQMNRLKKVSDRFECLSVLSAILVFSLLAGFTDKATVV